MKPNPHKISGIRWIATGDDGGAGTFRHRGVDLRFVVSWGEGWEHVSVSVLNRCPTWDEMCAAKDMFWEPEECVMQLHLPRSQWVNNHPYCLHLWKPTNAENTEAANGSRWHSGN